MKIEQKLQLDVIKGERIYYAEYDEYIFICDGHVGVYLTERELKIDKTKMHKMTGSSVPNFAPQFLETNGFEAHKTRTAVDTWHDGYAIKLKANNEDVSCFVKEKFLKMFSGFAGIVIQGKKEPVYIRKFGKPYGIAMPINIGDELE